jgi:tetratricopeptide (TPR) repeat protein
MTSTRRSAALSSLLLAAVIAAYAQAGRLEFLNYDTPSYVTRNPEVSRGLSWEGVRWAFAAFHASNWHPITWLSHMLDVQLFGLDASAHHWMNVGFHAANTLLVFLVLSAMTGAQVRSFLVALLFALHPLHVESVVWIAERKDVLSVFFGFASFACWIGWVRRRSAARYFGAVACCALSLMSKPMLVTLPCVLLLFDVWPFDRRGLGVPRLLVEKLPFFALAAASSWITVLAQRASGAVQTLEHLPLEDRLENAVVSYAAYLGRAIWPVGLTFYYPHPGADIALASVLFSAILLAALTALAIALFRRAPWLLVGWLFYLGTLFPVIGVVQVGSQSMADRYTYLPLLGIFVAATWAVHECVAGRPRLEPAAVALGAAISLLFGCMTWRQVSLWTDTETLCRHSIALDERNYVAHGLLGLALLERGDLARAEAELAAAVRWQPRDLPSLINLGSVLYREGRFAEAESIYRRSLEIAPERDDLHRDLALALWSQRRLPEALAEADEAGRLDPRSGAAQLTRAQILEEMGRVKQARVAIDAALELDPENLRARLTWARMSVRRGDMDAARAELSRILAGEPNDADALRELAQLFLACNRPLEALTALDSALRLRPGWALASSDVAWILATSADPNVQDPKRAVESAESAAESAPDDATVLDALAAAYASAGRFDTAIATAARAAAAARAKKDELLALRIEKRSAAYKSGSVDRKTPR